MLGSFNSTGDFIVGDDFVELFLLSGCRAGVFTHYMTLHIDHHGQNRAFAAIGNLFL